MSKDRSIAGTATSGNAAFQAGGRGAASRLPTAPRERKPALAALAVLLILAGALSTMVLVTRSGNRVDVLIATQDIPAGANLTRSNIGTQQVAADNTMGYLTAGQLDDLIKKHPHAGITLVKGTLLVSHMFDSDSVGDGPKAGEVALTVVVKPGQYPDRRLFSGDTVELYTTAKPDANSTTAAQPKIGNARILSVGGDPANLAVTLIVPESQAVQVFSSGGNLYIAKPGS